MTSAQKPAHGSMMFQKRDGPLPKPPENPARPISKALVLLVAPSKNQAPHNRQRGLKQYSHQEYQELRAKGLCFKCKQPYSPCMNAQIDR